MKILRITVKNIASLAGIQTVDFTQEPLKSAGLFGISGPTGAGKSSLLDAACLALFDATPRLHQVGNLEEIHSGEKQNNPRTLLRRGTASGFAEVAFVGVDQRIWTARWTVRRSRNRLDGKLQPAEMTLYQGNIPPGQDGIIEAGGRKMLVQQAIAEKVGLTFDQFTRAVLLAQNQFATFLKASDKERAEILQALTGTEQFQRISSAVFARATDEKNAVDELQLRLAGNESLSAEERQQAEQDRDTAAQRVRQVEKEIETLRKHAGWFDQHRQKQQLAERLLQQAVEKRSAGIPRRNTLEQTEYVQREAQLLWKTRRDSQTAAADAASALDTAAELLAQQTSRFQQMENRLAQANATLKQIRAEEEQTKPLLQTARKMDAQLEPLNEAAASAEGSLSEAKERQEEAAGRLADANQQRDALLNGRQEKQQQQERHAEFKPFVDDVAKWSHLLQEAGELREAVDRLSQQQAQTAEKSSKREAGEREACRNVKQAEEQWQQQRDALQSAETDELALDGAAIAEQRAVCDRELLALQQLEQQLQRRQALNADQQQTELTELNQTQDAEATRLKQLTNELLPESSQQTATAEEVLRRIEAAVDDHARQIRAELEDDQPCPVCGSCEHPYRQHAPDADSAAVSEARQHLTELRQQQESLHDEQRRLEVSATSLTEQIAKGKQQLSQLVVKLQTLQFDNRDVSAVAEILAAESSEQSALLTQHLKAAADQQAELGRLLQKQQKAARRVRELRDTEQNQRNALEQQRQKPVTTEKSVTELKSRLAVDTAAFGSAETQSRASMVELGDLWTGLPSSRQQFDDDWRLFCEEFQKSVTACGEITAELTTIASELKSVEAGIVPLKDALAKADQTLSRCTERQQAAVATREKLLQQRQQLFAGRAADVVESELTKRRQTAEQQVDQLTADHHQCDKSRGAADQQLARAKQNAQQTTAAAKQADCGLSAWLEQFNERYECQQTLPDPERMMARDEQWIASERAELKQQDDAVTQAESTVRERRQQVAAHQQQKQTTDSEEQVQLALAEQQTALKQVREAETAAAACLESDDTRRRKNQELAEQLDQQRSAADPWLKLNELIGSREGDKFRMIAQRRTLDILLQYANHQLRLLASRYRLERLKESLNLVVVDEEMGDERRSVHSLSGGESFLVSLSLALGLASLTSSRLKIETLFIDEGFGSLDPETLNTVMGALMHLEAQGRKVGVISHVAELTDAIPVQVHVIRRRGGSARIDAQGSDTIADDSSSGDSAESESVPPMEIEEIATRITQILRREQGTGREKVSLQALRRELGCETRQLKEAQQLLDGRVTVEGRSLRLV